MRSTAASAFGVVVAILMIGALAWGQGGGFGGPGGRPPGGRGGGGPQGDMQAMVYLEKSWTAVSFQLDCTPEQQEALKATYSAELATRNQALEQAMNNRDTSSMQKALETSKTDLNTKLKEVLSGAQWQKLQKLMQASAPPPPPDLRKWSARSEYGRADSHSSTASMA